MPIRDIGLGTDGIFNNESLRREVIAYAKDYEARAQPRLQHYLELLGPEEQRKKGPLVWRTIGWIHFIDAATEFYNWLERQGLRPRGSNPFTDIRRLPPLALVKGKTMIVERWYRKIMEYPHLNAYQRAILHLLSSGLRNHEVASARLDRLVLSRRMLEVVGKGGKVRKVFLFQSAAEAIDAYLKTRAHLASPWLFPSKRPGRYQHVTTDGILRTVAAVVRRVFPTDAEAPIRAKISPHKFRHFYVSNSLRKGMNEGVIMEQVGHGGRAMIDIYKSFDPVWVEREVRRIDRKGDRP